mmetsp:Transcript_288/g.538  ORF Transcript_288/g.538 Transcript_288/m.538 type:complete len:468 (-) Transcript_288:130-1533(-)
MATTDTSGGAVEEEDSSCPICLNDMCKSDTLHPIQCPTKCNFNFCIECLCHLLSSSKDDYEIASDGNRHVKVHLNCPNCRADISKTIEDTIRLRQTALAEELSTVPDSELSAKDLQLKHWKQEDEILDLTDGKKKKKKGPEPMLIDKSLFGGLEFAMTVEEQKYVTKLMSSGYPNELCQGAQILAGIADNIRNGRAVAAAATPATTAPNRAAAETARATAALQSGYSNAGLSSRSRDGDMPGVTNFQREMEQQKREKLRRPLPARMPLCVSLSTGEFEKMALQYRQQSGMVDPSMSGEGNAKKPGWKSFLKGMLGTGGTASMTFVDDEWDGSVADAFARAQIGRTGKDNRQTVKGRFGPQNPAEKASVQRIIAMGLHEDDKRDSLTRPIRFQRVLIGSVGGQAGKVGIKKGDVVTHINGEEFVGDAAALHALLVEAYEQQGRDGVIMIVVNAEDCTAEALRLRARVH